MLFPGNAETGLSGTSRKRDTICPAWCQLPPGHVAGSAGTGETTHNRLVTQIYLGEIELIRSAADQPVSVKIEQYTDPEGREHPPTIRLTLSSASSPDPDADDLTPAEARRLAHGLLEAVRLAESLATAARRLRPSQERSSSFTPARYRAITHNRHLSTIRPINAGEFTCASEFAAADFA